jgi:hypothetical protein
MTSNDEHDSTAATRSSRSGGASPVGSPRHSDHLHHSDDVERSDGIERTDHIERSHHIERSDDIERSDAHAREKFGGANPGAMFFGWLVAVGLAILLTSIIGAVLAAIGSQASITQTDAERSAGSIGVAAAVTLLVVLVIAYYFGGYVAGRMSRFDGGRQGVGVWVLGLLVTLIALGLGALFGSQYNVLDRVDLPRVPLSTDDVGLGGILTAVAVVVLTLLAAILGGKTGHRYHDRVDRAVHD